MESDDADVMDDGQPSQATGYRYATPYGAAVLELVWLAGQPFSLARLANLRAHFIAAQAKRDKEEAWIERIRKQQPL